MSTATPPRRRRWPWVLLALLLAGLAVPYLTAHREVLVLDAAAREALGGSYVTLADGVTHYELTGPADSPVVVLIHGGTIPSFYWERQVPALREAGFRVLRYDQFGRGYSDRPAVAYDRALYRRQLLELLELLGIDTPVHLVGHSFGGGVAVSFAAAHPARIASVALLAPVLHYAEGRALFRLAGLPGLGAWYVRVLGVPGQLERTARFFELAGEPEWSRQFDAQTRYQGFEDALLGFARSDALGDYSEAYASLPERPILLLWGDADRLIPAGRIERIRALVPSLQYVELPGVPHGLNALHHEEVNRHLLDFLR